ncbi:hypothetical protein NFHSH190041_36970 (plasmid) [Shewanella sp. NFH-SH190041]|uniref:phage N-6-adenine-methyltransferase n=1 Tax=Shewanella sp. NFH-SH190041 TaxID=2950245 RepID=UPI0021C4510F|nr:phage N-6-adenine-methyltransferase [Shewanella sp. NFH-SH190041]BDM66245.1 hypothetical protein NFHSH190041_36970 [Shewanella sp. NFH-SH190041]
MPAKINSYAKKLKALQKRKHHRLRDIGDQWQTPKKIATGLARHFAPQLGPVVLDMFADDCNHLYPNYYTARQNALTQDLAADLKRLSGAAYANPPYSRPFAEDDQFITGMCPIIDYCRQQADAGAKILLLVKAATSEAWWPDDADFIQFIAGRITFSAPEWYRPKDSKKDAPTSAGLASAVIIFDRDWPGEARPLARLSRDELILLGSGAE